MLHDYRCHKVILIQPDERKKRKTDRRDAAALSIFGTCFVIAASIARGVSKRHASRVGEATEAA